MATAAKVVTVQGEAFARSANGTMRRLAAGDSIEQGEVVITSAGGAASLRTADGQMMSINSQESFKFGPESIEATAPGAGESALAAGAPAATVIQPGEVNVEQLLADEAAAAGLGGGGENGGNSFVRLMRISEEVNPNSFDFQDPAGAGLLNSLGLDGTDDGVPIAGNLTITLDEDDIYKFMVSGFNFKSTDWYDEFREEAGAALGIYWLGNHDEADGDDKSDATSFPATRMTGTLNFSYGEDGVGDLRFNTPEAELTSGGQEVKYWLSDDGHTLVGYIGGREEQPEQPEYDEGSKRPLGSLEQFSFAKIIFTAEITDVAAGKFSFTIFGPLDHPNTDPNSDNLPEDNLIIPFGFTVTDIDGDSAIGTLTLNLDDDSPVLAGHYPQENVRGGFASDIVTLEDEAVRGQGGNDEWWDRGEGSCERGTIVDDVRWGADGFGKATEFTIDGQPFEVGTTVYWDQYGRFLGEMDDGPVYVDKTLDDKPEGGDHCHDKPNIAAKLIVNEDGSYTFVLIDNMLMGKGEQGEQINFLDRVTITAEDGDGDPIDINVNLEVQDDKPEASCQPILYAMLEEESVPEGRHGVIGVNEDDNWGWPGPGFSYTTGPESILGAVHWGADGFGKVVSVTVGESCHKEVFLAKHHGMTYAFFDEDGRVIEPRDWDGKSSFGADGRDGHGDDHYPRDAAVMLQFDDEGNYQMTVLGPLDVEGRDENWAWLPKIEFNAQDGDGDKIDVRLVAAVQDDKPGEMAPQTAAIVEDESYNSATDEPDDNSYISGNQDYGKEVKGDVSDNGNWGADGFDRITQIKIDGSTYDVPQDDHGHDGHGHGSGHGDHDDTLTVYWDDKGNFLGKHLDYGERAAASLEVESDGGYTFKLLDNMLIRSGQGEIQDLLDNVIFTGQDKDGDPATISLDLKVMDDMPTLSIGTVNDSSVLLTTQDADTVDWVEHHDGGHHRPDWDELHVETDSTWTNGFKTAFESAVSVNYGADGGSKSISGYALKVLDSVSGLKSDGLDIALSKVDNAVVGKTGGNLEIFRITVDGSGKVTLYQYKAVDHKEGTSEDAIIALANGKVQLGATVTVTDNDGDMLTQPITVDLGGNIRFEDDNPDADNYSKSLSEDTSVAIDLVYRGNVEYGADGAGGITITGNPAHGTVNLVGGVATYMPYLNYNGTDSFKYTVTDDDGDTVEKTVCLTVTPVNDAPMIGKDYIITNQTDTVTVKDAWLLANDTDVDTPASSLKITDADAASVQDGYLFDTLPDHSNSNKTVTFDLDTNKDSNYDFYLKDGESTSLKYTLSDGSLPDADSAPAVTITYESSNTLQGGANAEILIGTSSGETLKGGSGDDILVGGQGRDTLEGEGGADTFVWRLSDLANDSADTVKGFSKLSGDILDLQDLLEGEHASASSLNALMTFQKVGNDTVLTINDTVAGSGTGNYDTITFKDTNLFDQFLVTTNDSDALVTEMLKSHQLKVDP